LPRLDIGPVSINFLEAGLIPSSYHCIWGGQGKIYARSSSFLYTLLLAA